MVSRLKLFVFSFFIFVFSLTGVKADTLSDGVYKIESALDNTKVISLKDGQTVSKTNVEISTFHDNYDKWRLNYVGNGYYSITNFSNNDMSLDVEGAKNKNGTNVWLYKKNNTDAQKWLLKSAGDGYFYIVSKCNGLYLDVAGGNSSNGTNIQMYKGNGTNAQKFKLVEILDKKRTIDDGTYFINSKLSTSLALSIDSDNVNLNQANSSDLEVFSVKYLDDGFYEINFGDKVFSVLNNTGKNGANVFVNNSSNLDGQKWIIKENSDNTYSIVSALDNYYLDIYGAKTDIGTNVQLYKGNGTDAQKFVFTKVDLTVIPDGFYNILASDNLALSIDNEVAFNGGNIQLSVKNDGNNQKWYIKNIEKNIYEVKSAVDDSYVFDVTSASFKNQANIHVYKTNKSDAQKWTIVKLANGSYRFTNIGSGKNLDVKNGKIIANSNIWQYENNNSKAQEFKLVTTERKEYNQIIDDDDYIVYSSLNLNKSIRCNDSAYINDVEGVDKEIISFRYIGDGFYTLKNGGKFLTNVDGKILLKDEISNDSQKWFALRDDNYYTFISKMDGKVIDLTSANVNNGNSLQLYKSNNSLAQKFYLEKVMSNDIESGYYTISFADKLIGLSSEFAHNGMIPLLNGLDNINTQKWYIKKLGSNLYEVKYALNPTKVLDVSNAKVSDGTNVQVYSSNSSVAQRWHIVKLADGTYKFISHLSHSCLTLDSNITKIFSNNANKNQKFKIAETDSVTVGMSVEEGYYTITSSLNSSKALDVVGGVMKSGTNVQLYSLNNSVAQIWKIKYIDNGLYYIISALNPKRALTNVNGNVQINKFNQNDNQKWYIKVLEDGKVIIVSGSDSFALDVAGAKTSNGTNIGVYSSNGTLAQKFILNSNYSKKTYRGIDISKWQGYIDWNKLEKTDTHFVIMRVGYGMFSWQNDVNFDEYYSNCLSRDIPVGVYTYSYAKSTSDATEEGKVTVEWLNKRKLDLPVFYDIEESYMKSYSKSKLTSMANNFCSEVTKAGYKCGIYSNKNFLIDNIDTKALSKKYPIWVAHYTGPDDYASAVYHPTSYNFTPFQYWQFSSLGKTSGVSTAVDLDFGYDIYD